MLTIADLLLTLRGAGDLLLEGKKLDRMLCPYELDRLKLEFLANGRSLAFVQFRGFFCHFPV